MHLRSHPVQRVILKAGYRMYAGHLRLPCFFVQSLQWQEYQVLPSVLMETNLLATGSADSTIGLWKSVK